jgi:hypothetical protein
MAIFRGVGYFIFICLKDSASLLFLSFFTWSHTHEGKQGKNTNGNMQSVITWKKGKKKLRSRVLQAYENKISYTPADGHVSRNMQRSSENQHNKAARRRIHNLQYPLNNTVQQDAKI